MPTDHEYYRDLLKAMLPPGAFALEAGDLPADICSALAKVLAQAEERGDQVALEALPHTAEECLTEWEEMLDSPAMAGATEAERQAALVGLWRLAVGMSLRGIRSVLELVLNSEYQFTDTMDDEDVSWRLDERAGNCTITETTTEQEHDTSTADCRWDASNKLAGMVLLPDVDPDDDFWIAVEVKAVTLGGADCGGGVVLYNDDENNMVFGPRHDGVGIELRLWGLEENVAPVVQDFGAPGAAPYWLIAGREAGVLKFYQEASLPSPFSVDGLSPLATHSPTWSPRMAGLLTQNGGGPAAAVMQWDELRAAYKAPHNNIEIIETPGALATSPEDIYFAFVHRRPGDSGNYDLVAAQRLCDKAAPGHALLIVGESDCFRCDDPYSLTDRDVLGS